MIYQTRPNLSEAAVVVALRRHYRVQIASLSFLPLGQDVAAWTYRAATEDGAAYFLKLRRGAVSEASVRAPRYLADHGVHHVVAPLRTRADSLWGTVDEFTFTLYPFISGSTGMAHGMDEQQWAAFGGALRGIHAAPLAPDFARSLPRETFSSDLAEAVRALGAQIDRSDCLRDPVEREVASFWQSKRLQIEALVRRFERLGELLRAARPAQVLCHADVHPNNILIDTEDRLWIVDWEDTRLAPKECDLMMGIGGLGMYPAGPSEEAWFLRGYGTTAVDPLALAYYRHVRALGDIAAYGEQALRMPNAGETTKRNALRWLELLFSPGYIVSLAEQAERLTM